MTAHLSIEVGDMLRLGRTAVAATCVDHLQVRDGSAGNDGRQVEVVRRRGLARQWRAEGEAGARRLAARHAAAHCARQRSTISATDCAIGAIAINAHRPRTETDNTAIAVAQCTSHDMTRRRQLRLVAGCDEARPESRRLDRDAKVRSDFTFAQLSHPMISYDKNKVRRRRIASCN